MNTFKDLITISELCDGKLNPYERKTINRTLIETDYPFVKLPKEVKYKDILTKLNISQMRKQKHYRARHIWLSLIDVRPRNVKTKFVYDKVIRWLENHYVF